MNEFLPFFVIIPLGAGFLTVLLAGRIRHASAVLANLAAGSLLVLSLLCVNSLSRSGTLAFNLGGWASPLGIKVVLDGLSGFILVVVNLVSFLAMIYAASYMRIYTARWKFYALFMLMLAGMNGVLLSGDLFNMYVFLELASISGYALVAFGVEPEDVEASFKYLIMGALASIFILLGIALTYSYASTLNMSDIAHALALSPNSMIITLISILFLTGFGLKAAIVPFHAWLADAHSSAPTPVSAVLSGVFIKTLGIYALSRVFFNILGVTPKILFIFMILGIFSMILGAFLAIIQKDIKRMLAYSSISQVGYIIFALGVGTPLAILGGLFYLLNHAVFKSLLFLNAGTIEYSTGTRDLNKLGGLNSQMPVSGYTSLLGSMSISGIPPLGGFWSKLIIIIAAIQAGFFGFAFVAALVSIVTLGYYFRFQTFAFFGQPVTPGLKIKKAAWSMNLAMIILALIAASSALVLLPGFRNFLDSAVGVLAKGNI